MEGQNKNQEKKPNLEGKLDKITDLVNEIKNSNITGEGIAGLSEENKETLKGFLSSTSNILWAVSGGGIGIASALGKDIPMTIFGLSVAISNIANIMQKEEIKKIFKI